MEDALAARLRTEIIKNYPTFNLQAPAVPKQNKFGEVIDHHLRVIAFHRELLCGRHDDVSRSMFDPFFHRGSLGAIALPLPTP